MTDLDIQFGRLFRKIERTTGTGNMSISALRALADAASSYSCDSWESFFSQYRSLFRCIENTRPRFSVIIDGFYEVFRRSCQMRRDGVAYESQLIGDMVEAITTEYTSAQSKVVECGADLIGHNDVILIYDHSTTVGKVLLEGLRRRKQFRVIIAKQSEEKTNENIEFCLDHSIPFQVIPTYMLTHIEDMVTKVFTGAVTLKSTFKFIMDPGSMQVVSEFHLRKTPMYVFLQTKKLSLWEDSGAIHDVHIKEKTLVHEEKKLQYDFMSFSHDRIDMGMFDGIVTEEGMFSAGEMEAIFTERFEERKKLKKKILGAEK